MNYNTHNALAYSRTNTYTSLWVNDSIFIIFFNSEMATGTVKFFDTTKWFGFIKNSEDENDQAFVHISALNGLVIKEDDKVSYETQETEKGKNAINISIINEDDMAMAA